MRYPLKSMGLLIGTLIMSASTSGQCDGDSLVPLKGTLEKKGEIRIVPDDGKSSGGTRRPVCFTIIFPSDALKKRTEALIGKHVSAIGHYVMYSHLDDPVDSYSRILSRRSWRGKSVYNYCGEDKVFLIDSLKSE